MSEYIIGAHAVGIGESDAYLELRLGRRTFIGLYPDYTRTSVSDMRDEVSKIAAFEVASCDSSVV